MLWRPSHFKVNAKTLFNIDEQTHISLHRDASEVFQVRFKNLNHKLHLSEVICVKKENYTAFGEMELKQTTNQWKYADYLFLDFLFLGFLLDFLYSLVQ